MSLLVAVASSPVFKANQPLLIVQTVVFGAPELALNEGSNTGIFYVFLFYVAVFLKRGHHIGFGGVFRRLISRFLH